MSIVLLDTNIVSYLFKRDTRAELYVWVAATALRYRLPLVTHNPDDFQQIPGLKVITEA